MLWPQGRSFCRDQSKSFWLSPRSTYRHIQMPSVYCENRSIGWNNTVTGDNVPVRDDLWSSFGFTDSGAVTCYTQQLQSTLLYECHIPLTPPPPTRELPSSFPTTFSVRPPPSCLSSFSTQFHLFFSILLLPTLTPHFPRLPCIPYEPPPFTPVLPLLPTLADCQHLQVSCGHFSFIILSKSGTALVQGDWVSVKHQELIEFVLKWVIAGTLLM